MVRREGNGSWLSGKNWEVKFSGLHSTLRNPRGHQNSCRSPCGKVQNTVRHLEFGFLAAWLEGVGSTGPRLAVPASLWVLEAEGGGLASSSQVLMLLLFISQSFPGGQRVHL